MKPSNFHTALIFAVSIGASAMSYAQTNNYFGTTGTLNGSVWSTNPAGPYTSALNNTGGAIINFENATGSPVTGASITVARINATANTTLTAVNGTISNFGDAVIAINVASSTTLDFSTQGFTTSATAGYNFTGPGVLALAGGAYGGGFTINSGTVILRGVNAMGGAAGNTLTINGGTIAANATRVLTDKYSGGITVGGNFTLGATTGLASSAANLTFTNDMALGSSTRTITIGGTGVYTFGGIVSGASGTGLVVDATAAGRLTLTTAATYNGGTTIKGGILADGVTTAGHTDTFGSGSITLGDSSGSKDAALYGFTASSTANVFTGALTVANGSSGTLAIVGNNTTMTFSNSVALNNNLTLANANTGKTITLSGPITQISNGTGYTITNGATIAGTSATASLTGPATLSGGVEIGTGGLTLTNNAALLFTVGTGNITSTTTGNLTLNANNTGAFTVSAANINHTGSITNSGTGSGVTTISGIIGSNVTGLTQNSGNSRLVLTGANSAFIGNTALTSGTLQLQNTNSLQNSVVNMNGGSVSFGTSTSIGLSSVALGGLAGSGNINLNNFLTVPTAVNLTIGNSNGQNATYSGALSNTNGSASLTKVGTNTQTLSGVNIYTGATAVNAGKLIVGLAGAGSITSNVTVASSAALGGSGTVTGNVTLSAESSSGAKDGGKLAPGNSPGVLTATGTTTFNTGSIFTWTIDTDANTTGRGTEYAGHNTTSVSGSGAVFQILSADSEGFGDNFWTTNHTWTDIFKNANGSSSLANDWSSVFSSFAYTNGTSSLSPAGYGGFTWENSGNTLKWTYSAVPEPTTALAGLLIGAGLLRRRRA